MKKILLLFVFAGCSITPKEEFIRNIYGTYNLLDSVGKLDVSSTGAVSQDGKDLYKLYMVFTSISALYTVSHPNLGNGYVTVSFQNNILYISSVFADINKARQVQLNAYAIRIG